MLTLLSLLMSPGSSVALAFDTLPPEHVVGLWVSDLDGRNLREIGHLALHPAANSDTDGPDPEDVQWLPDGKRLSFLYKQALWIVPID
jgi:hypothetical protein